MQVTLVGIYSMAMKLEEGTKVGKYRIDSQLGEGSVALVDGPAHATGAPGPMRPSAASRSISAKIAASL